MNIRDKIEDYNENDFQIENYLSHDPIKMEMRK